MVVIAAGGKALQCVYCLRDLFLLLFQVRNDFLYIQNALQM